MSKVLPTDSKIKAEIASKIRHILQTLTTEDKPELHEFKKILARYSLI